MMQDDEAIEVAIEALKTSDDVRAPDAMAALADLRLWLEEH